MGPLRNSVARLVVHVPTRSVFTSSDSGPKSCLRGVADLFVRIADRRALYSRCCKLIRCAQKLESLQALEILGPFR
jgi:hypothetical protein